MKRLPIVFSCLLLVLGGCAMRTDRKPVQIGWGADQSNDRNLGPGAADEKLGEPPVDAEGKPVIPPMVEIRPDHQIPRPKPVTGPDAGDPVIKVDVDDPPKPAPRKPPSRELPTSFSVR